MSGPFTTIQTFRIRTNHPSERAVAEIDVDRRQVTAIDHGGGFDVGGFGQLPRPEHSGGRGLHLAQTICPDMSVNRTSDGMRFTLPFPR